MTDTTSFDERVRRGIALLEDYQAGCTDHINLETLDLYHTNWCALAQAIGQGSYGTGLVRLGLPFDDDDDTAPYGFSLTYMETHAAVTDGYERLREAWVRLLTEHRKA